MVLLMALLTLILFQHRQCQREAAAGDGEDGAGRDHEPWGPALAHGRSGRAICPAGRSNPTGCRSGLQQLMPLCLTPPVMLLLLSWVKQFADAVLEQTVAPPFLDAVAAAAAAVVATHLQEHLYLRYLPSQYQGKARFVSHWIRS